MAPVKPRRGKKMKKFIPERILYFAEKKHACDTHESYQNIPLPPAQCVPEAGIFPSTYHANSTVRHNWLSVATNISSVNSIRICFIIILAPAASPQLSAKRSSCEDRGPTNHHQKNIEDKKRDGNIVEQHGLRQSLATIDWPTKTEMQAPAERPSKLLRAMADGRPDRKDRQ